MKVGDCKKKLGEENEAVTAISEAGTCYKKLNPVEAIQAFQAAIEIYNAGGRFGRSAALTKDIAEIYEADGNVDGAIESFESAANLYHNDNKKSVGQQMLLKVAVLCSGTKGDYAKAAQIFETVGREAMESNLSKYSAKNYLFQALLCFLAAGDTVTAKSKKEDYKNVDYTFATQRECVFVEKLLALIEVRALLLFAFLSALQPHPPTRPLTHPPSLPPFAHLRTQANDGEGYATACAEFDRITPLDPWKTSVLLKAKKSIAGEGGGGGESDLC